MNLKFAGIATGAALVALFNTVYIVNQTQQGIVLRFGEPMRLVNPYDPKTADPGLKVKVPFLENVVMFDRRNLNFEAAQEEIIAADQQRLVVDAVVRWRIADPLKFYQAVRDVRAAEGRLEPLLNSSLRDVLGTATSAQVISGQRAILMQRIKGLANMEAQRARLGIEIIDVRIKRADLPDANSKAVYRRMVTARQQEATEIRAKGEERKREVTAEADREVTVVLATAQEQAQKIRGAGDAERARLFASSFGRDPEFAGFYRAMQAYETSMQPGTQVVISPDSAFFKAWRNGAGR
jgi:membrane protease subunit HflC